MRLFINQAMYFISMIDQIKILFLYLIHLHKIVYTTTQSSAKNIMSKRVIKHTNTNDKKSQVVKSQKDVKKVEKIKSKNKDTVKVVKKDIKVTMAESKKVDKKVDKKIVKKKLVNL